MNTQPRSLIYKGIDNWAYFETLVRPPAQQVAGTNGPCISALVRQCLICNLLSVALSIVGWTQQRPRLIARGREPHLLSLDVPALIKWLRHQEVRVQLLFLFLVKTSSTQGWDKDLWKVLWDVMCSLILFQRLACFIKERWLGVS